MPLPKWLWDPESFSAGWAWGWKLKGRQRREARKLADAGKTHPDPHVAGVARHYATTRPSTREFAMETIIFIVIVVAVVVAVKLWTSFSVAGGLAAAIVGIGFSFWRRMETARLSKAYRDPEATATNNTQEPPA